MATLQRNLILVVVLSLCSAFVNLAVPCVAQHATSDTWRWGPILSQRRTAFSSCQAGDAIVTVGGTFWSDLGTADATKCWLASVERFAPDTGKWSHLPEYPVKIDYALVALVGQRLVVAGGQNGDDLLSHTMFLDLEDLELRWQKGPQLPRPLARMRGGVWNRCLVTVTDEPLIHEQSRPAGPRVLVWNTSETTGQWQDIGAVPEPSIGNRAAAVAGDKLYVFGGATPDAHGQLRPSACAWCLDLAERKWRECAKLPFAVRDATACPLHESWIAIVGGVEEVISADGTPDGEARIILSTRVTLYDSKADRFIAAQPLPLAVADHGLMTVGDQLYVVGGEDSPFRTRTDLVQSANWHDLIANAKDGQVLGTALAPRSTQHAARGRVGVENM